ncbi:hypothetical protein BaRGS_00026964 [Batillaria attramentaria]|uniref:Uncharacterized protein n=1 Tax=Batillaria attramentaria TaxID=370345 RepID=A0ABD0K4R5_9CAEN
MEPASVYTSVGFVCEGFDDFCLDYHLIGGTTDVSSLIRIVYAGTCTYEERDATREGVTAHGDPTAHEEDRMEFFEGQLQEKLEEGATPTGQNIVKYTQSNSPETSELRQDPLQYAQRLIWDDTSISSHDLLSVASELRSYASSLMAVASQLLSRAAQLSTGEPHPAGFITKSDTYPISVISDVACENDNVAFGSARQLFTDGGSFLSSDSESDSESSDLDDTVSVDGHVDVDSIDDGGQIVCQDYGFCNPQAALGSDFPASAVQPSSEVDCDQRAIAYGYDVSSSYVDFDQPDENLNHLENELVATAELLRNPDPPPDDSALPQVNGYSLESEFDHPGHSITSGDGNINAALSLAIEMRDPDEWLDAQAAEANAEDWEEDDPEEDDGVECLEDGIRRGLIRMRWYMRLVSPRNNFQRTPLGNTPPLARTHRLLTDATFDVDLTTGTLADPIRINGGTHTETVDTENSFGSAPLPASEPDEYTAEDE